MSCRSLIRAAALAPWLLACQGSTPAQGPSGDGPAGAMEAGTAVDSGEAGGESGPPADAHHPRDDGGGALDRPLLPELAPLGADAGRPPDAGAPPTTGPATLRLTPSALSMREARGPVAVRLDLAGDADGRFEVELAATGGLQVTPDRATLSNDARSLVAWVTAPIDADADDTFGRLSAGGAGLDAISVPFVVRDAHLTWEMALDESELQFVRTSNDKTRRLTVENTFNGRAAPPAEINLRGKGTLVCPRRSFTVRFEHPVHLQDSPPLEDVVLLSMCEDPLVLRSRISLEILSRLDLFPAWFSYVELRYGGETRGVYLMVERPRAALARISPDLSRIIRRLSDADVEIDHPDESSIPDREAFLAPYRAIFTAQNEWQGEQLLAELLRRMAYDQYLLLLAYNSVLENGDYIDEVYFYDRAPPPSRLGAESPFFDVMAWDQDETFRRCHTPAPIADPLLNCAESRLDRLVVTQPPVRALYVSQLRRLLDGPTSAASLEGVSERAAAELAVYLDRPGVRPLHVVDEQPAPEASTARETYLELARARREHLQAALQAENP
ncbi:CotH kinase family protein [Myxococcota bacterium]|nr:CotH kinase family protein [Myxococcota bacterium]